MIKINDCKFKIYIRNCILFIAFALLMCIIYLFRNNLKDKTIENNFVDYYQSWENINNVDNYFSNRDSLIIKEDNLILIGRSKKELENEYYDIKFNINIDNIIIIINNLQKEDIDFKSISDEYLIELKSFLSILLNDENIDELVKQIEEEYIKLRSNNECIEDEIDYKQISINQYIINFNIENNMLKLDIKMR